MTIESKILRIATGQRNLVTRRQLEKIHVTDEMTGSRVGSGRWVTTRHLGVYAVVGAVDRELQALLAACLAAGHGAVVSHRTGAALWDLEGITSSTIEITMPYGHCAELHDVVVHRSRNLGPSDRARYKGIPVTTPTRTIIDIAGEVDFDSLEIAADDAHRRNLITYHRLRHHADRLCGQGRAGSTAIKRLLAQRDPNAPVAGSSLETRFHRLLKLAKLPLPVSQHEIYEGREFIARVDFAYPDIKLALEVDGYRWHTGRTAHDKRLARRRGLQGLGWLVAEFTWPEIVNEPEAVRSDVAKHIALRPLDKTGR